MTTGVGPLVCTGSMAVSITAGNGGRSRPSNHTTANCFATARLATSRNNAEDRIEPIELASTPNEVRPVAPFHTFAQRRHLKIVDE